MQWNSPKNTAKPGANWTPQPMAATTGAGYRPMVSVFVSLSLSKTLYLKFIRKKYKNAKKNNENKYKHQTSSTILLLICFKYK